MSQKFTFIIEVNKKGEPVGHPYARSSAAEAVAHFNSLREAGIEAYLYQFPVPDKKSKSAAQHAATSAATAQPTAEEKAKSDAEAKLAAKEAAEAAEARAQEAAVANMVKKSKNKISGV